MGTVAGLGVIGGLWLTAALKCHGVALQLTAASAIERAAVSAIKLICLCTKLGLIFKQTGDYIFCG